MARFVTPEGEVFEVGGDAESAPNPLYEFGVTPRPPGARDAQTARNEEQLRDYALTAEEGFKDWGRGLQVWDRENQQAARAEAAPGIAAAKERSPVMGWLGDNTPELMAGLATAKNPMAMVGMGGAEGLRLRDSAGDQVINAGIGAIAPGMGLLLGRVWNTARGMADDALTESSKRAAGVNMATTAGEKSGGGMVGAIEAAGKDIPFSGAGGPLEARQVELNEAANAAIGQSGPLVTAENLSNAAEHVGKLRESVNESIGAVQLPEVLADRIREIYPRLRNRKAFDQFGDFGTEGPGKLKAGEATNLFRRMVQQADTATDSNVQTDIIEEILPAFEEMITGKLGSKAQDWRDYREMWRMHSLLREGKSVTGGNVNPAALRGRMARNMPGAIQMNQMDNLSREESKRLATMVDLTGGGWLGVPKADSGTAFRAARSAVPLMAAGADAALMGTGMPPLVTAGAAGLLGANAGIQAGMRAAPDLVGGVSAQRGIPNAAGTAGSMLDELLYPFVGRENEIEPTP